MDRARRRPVRRDGGASSAGALSAARKRGRDAGGHGGAPARAGTLHRAVQRRSPAAAQGRAPLLPAHASRGAGDVTGTRGTRGAGGTRVPPEPEAPGARDADAPDDALVLAAQVLQRATEDAGFSWRESDMTIDDAINALPVDIADNTVAMMHRIFATAGDEENTTWTDEKLREIKLLKRGYRRLYELVAATPREEVLAKSRAYGVPDDLTEDFVAGMLSSQIPTVAELLAARLPVDAARPRLNRGHSPEWRVRRGASALLRGDQHVGLRHHVAGVARALDREAERTELLAQAGHVDA